MSQKITLTLVFVLSSCLFCFANEVDDTSASPKPKLERHFVFDAIPLNLEEIEDRADRIFAGICTNSEEIEKDAESSLPVVQYTFKVTEAIKGVKNDDEITFKQWQPTTRASSYEIGEKYILFLYPDSSLGLTSTVGVDQGYFEIEKKGFIRRKEVVSNRLKNKGLSRNLKTQKRISIDSDSYINDYVDRCSELGIPMRYKEFVRAVRHIVEK